ncbi:eCIS core domain-containing protein [Nitrospira sp. NS4]|uniref:eCIS core domain-containing protein n=1 Tax=Nitrospira sp. NS4 TaxID=3414498 RepID=UPI003C2F68A0
MAERIMRMPGPVMQRQCTACAAGGPPCPACDEEKAMPVSRKAGGATGGEAPVSVDSAIGSPGQPLAASVRAFFEPRFGQDLSHVRVHTDGVAQQSARDVNALAYTVGSHVVFDAGRYAPGTPDGQRLLAHELTHVMQQSGTGTGGGAQVQRTVASTNCRGGVSSAPADPTATLTTLEERAVGLAQAAAILAAVGSAAATMDIDVTTHPVGQSFAARFGLPPAVRGGFQNRFTGRVHPTLNEALSKELERLSDRLQSIADLYAGPVRYRCITGATTFADCDTHCRGRAASACEGVRVIFLCPTFWGITGPERQALLLIHEGAHVRFGNPSHSVSGRLHNFRHPECLASFVADLFGHGTNTPACPAP